MIGACDYTLRSLRALIAPVALAALLLMTTSTCRAQSPLTSVPGSPFTSTSGAFNSDVVLLRPGEQQLFVSNTGSNTITVNDVAANGALTLHGVYTASNLPYAPTVIGLATNPAGDRLYVVGLDFNGTSSVSVHSVAADGTLTWLQDALLPSGSYAKNGIVYVSQAGGDTLYVNDNAYTNQVSAFQVAADGTLVTPSTDYNTGGTSYPYGFWESPSLRAGGGYLFAQNGTMSSPGSNDISVFKINADGSLTPITGSPFKLPNGANTSGPLALDAAHGLLYAGAYNQIVKFSIGSDGTLTSLGAFPAGQNVYGIDALQLRPDGTTLAATAYYSNQIEVVDTASMRPLFGSPVNSDAPTCAGAVFDGAGARLFVGDDNYNGVSRVSVYSFTQTPVQPPLAIQLKVTGASVDKFGTATITGTITSSLPMYFYIPVMLRQKQGHTILTASGSVNANTVGINGKATWTCKVSSPTQAFKGGTAEVIASTSGNDPVTGAYVPANLDQAVQLGGK